MNVKIFPVYFQHHSLLFRSLTNGRDITGPKQVAANVIIHNTLKFVTDSATTLSVTTLCDLIYRCLAKCKYYEKGVKDEIPSDLKKAYLKPPEGGDTSNVAWARMPVCYSFN